MDPPGPKTVSDSQTNRACNACRAHKVRCLPDPSGSSKTCQRCARTDRQCLFAAAQKRKQRKRTDVRVAELEKEVLAMRTLFDGKNPTRGDRIGPEVKGPSNTLYNVDLTVKQSAPSHHVGLGGESQELLAREVDNSSSQERNPSAYPADSDVWDRGIISFEDASRLFQSYNNNLVQHFPGVVFDSTVTAEECRKTRPTLFLAVIAAAAGQTDPRLYSLLNTEVLNAYAYRTVINHEKSLELVQAMIVSSIWYYPPGRYAQLKFYEYIHMAATMAVSEGLGSSPQSSRSRRGIDPEIEATDLSTEDIEKRRTFLACYIITATIAMSMRRPTMLRFTSWTRECLETIANVPSATNLDRCIASWAKLSNITEEIGTSFTFDDPSNMPDLTETRVQIMLAGFEKELRDWRKSFEYNGLTNDAIMIQYHQTQIYLHEIALHDDHPPENFIPPARLSKILAIHTVQGASSSYLEASAISISSSHALLDIFLKMEMTVLRALPIANFVKVVYAITILTKLYISSKSPESKIRAVLDAKSIKLGYYIKSTTDMLVDASGTEQYRAPYTFVGLLMRLQIWFEGQKNDEHFKNPTDIHQQLDDCWLMPVPKVQWDTWRNFIQQAKVTEVSPPDYQRPPKIDKSNMMHGNVNDNTGLGNQSFLLSAASRNSTDINDPMIAPVVDDMNMTMNDMNEIELVQYDTEFGFDSWVPSVDLPGIYDSPSFPEISLWDFSVADDGMPPPT